MSDDSPTGATDSDESTTAVSSSPASSSTGPRGKRRTVRIVLTALAVVVILGFFLVPLLASSVVESTLKRQIAEQGLGDATFESISVGWTGRAHIEGLKLASGDGPIASVETIDADLGVFRVIGGTIAADVRIVRPRFASRSEAGRSILRILEAIDSPEAATAADKAPKRAAGDTEPTTTATAFDRPRLQISLEVVDGAVHDASDRTLVGFDVSLVIDDDLGKGRGALTVTSSRTSEPARVEIDLKFGAGGQPVEIDYVIDGVDFAIVSPFVDPSLSGQFQGRGHLDLGAFTGDFALKLESLTLQTEGVRINMPRAEIVASSVPDSDGVPTWSAVFRGSDWGELTANGVGDDARSGTVSARFDLQKLSREISIGDAPELVGSVDLEGQTSLDGSDRTLDLTWTGTSIGALRDGEPVIVDPAPTIELAALVGSRRIKMNKASVRVSALQLDASGGLDADSGDVDDGALTFDLDVAAFAADLRSLGIEPALLDGARGRLNGDFALSGNAENKSAASGDRTKANLSGFLQARNLVLQGEKDSTRLVEERGTLNAALGLGAGSTRLESIEWRGFGVELTGSGRPNSVGFQGPVGVRGTVRATLIPDELDRVARCVLGQLEFRGDPVVVDLKISEPKPEATAVLDVTSKRITLFDTEQNAPSLDLSDLVGQCNLLLQPSGRFEILPSTFQSSKFFGKLSGRGKGSKSLNARLELNGDLSQLPSIVPAATRDMISAMSGTTDAKLDIERVGNRLTVTGPVTADQLRMTLPVTRSGRDGSRSGVGASPTGVSRTIEDPNVEVDVALGFDIETGQPLPSTLNIDAKSVRGNVSTETTADGYAVTSKLRYDPETLFAFLRPEALQLVGRESQPLDVNLIVPGNRGTTSLLKSVRGTATFGVPPIRFEGLPLSGPIDAVLENGVAALSGSLASGNGSVSVDGTLIDLTDSESSKSSVVLTLEQVAIDDSTASLLSRIHPLFSIAKETMGATAAGKLQARVGFGVDAALSTLSTTPWTRWPLSGNGHAEVSAFTAAGSPLFDSIVEAFGVEETRNIDLNPIDFSISRGRVNYDRPIEMKVDGTPMFWEGSIGLDHTLDLALRIPVTEELRKEVELLKDSEVSEIVIPIQGSALRPRIDLHALASSLVRKELEAQGRKAIDDAIGGAIGDLFGGSERDGEPSKDDRASELLRQADELWQEGKRAEAKPLYQEIRQKYRKTLTYTLNRSRIKSRGRD